MASTNKREKSISSVIPEGGPKPGFSSGKPVKKTTAKEGEADTMTTENVTKEKNDKAGLPDPKETAKP